MSKNVLIVTASLRPNSNSDALAAAFERGAGEAGNHVETVSLKGKTIGFCVVPGLPEDPEMRHPGRRRRPG